MLKLRFSEPCRKQYLNGKISLCKYHCTIIDNSTKRIVTEFTVTGTAKCSPKDTVDLEFGSKLADSRAKLNAYKAASKLVDPSILEAWIERINEQITKIDFIDQMQYLKKKELAHIMDLCTEV